MHSFDHTVEHESIKLSEEAKSLQKPFSIQEEENSGLTISCCKYNMLLLISK